MEVRIISRELIKPLSLPIIQLQEPYRLSVIDQITPTTYSPIILFYACNKNDSSFCVDQLKRSLSQFLDIYYPFSGRVVDNLFVDHFHEGVPFFEARVDCCMSHFVKHQEIDESLNKFLPYRPLTKEDPSVPLFACQVSMFSCGGIALGFSFSHKLMDAATLKVFIATWTSISRGDVNGIVKPALTEPQRYFPPTQSFAKDNLTQTANALWFKEANYVTRRFVFDAKAIATLKAMAVKGGAAESKRVSRIEILSCFIWKCCMSATKAIAESSNPSILVEAVNLRKRTKPPMSDGAIGNNFCWTTAVANPADANTEWYDLVNQLQEAIKLFDTDYTRSLPGEGGAKAVLEFYSHIARLIPSEKEDIFVFSSLRDIRLTQTNFGWGTPLWVGVLGKAGPAFMNLTVFVETVDGKGVEAWVTLDEPRMRILERDPNFLAFCSSNPKRISSL